MSTGLFMLFFNRQAITGFGPGSRQKGSNTFGFFGVRTSENRDY